MPGSTPATSQLDWLISTTAMIVLFWSRATRDLLKSFGWGIAALHRLMQRRSCHPRRPPHSISPLEGDGFELLVPPHELQRFRDRHVRALHHLFCAVVKRSEIPRIASGHLYLRLAGR